ncbi:MAG: fibronectin type III domain-containing protein, partial [Bacteroidales bacterium]|nr:fibronectin type III domain-containing protein [Bacteroidales bacterium]
NWAYAAQVTVTVGTGTDVSGTAITPFGTGWEDGQNQMLFTTLELNIAGIGAGDITEIGWEVISTGGAMNGFNIEMKTTSATSATSFESGFTNVYSTAYTPVAGWNVFTLTTPFNWDGTSNLLVKVCFDNTSYTDNSTVYYTAGSYADMNAWAYNDGTSGCSDPYEGTTNRPNTRITGEEFTGMLPPGVPTNPSPADGATSVAITGDLTWDFGSDTDTYDLWYGPAGSMTQVVIGEIAGATGLYGYAADFFSNYEWQVIAYNSAKGTTNGPVWTFKTKCDVFTAPFSENFDGVTTPALPDCWSKIEITSSGYVQTYANYYYSPPNCVRMRITNQSDKCILITPELSDLTSQSNRITFQGQALTYVQDVIVGTMSDPTDETTFTPYQTISLSLNSYTEYTVNFDANYTLTDKYIAFKDASTYNYRIMTIDDFVYEPMPSCLKPTDLTATNNGITSIDLGWTENNTPMATAWEIEYGDQGFAQGTGTTVVADANPFHLTGLTINYNYSFYVRTNCGGGDYSAWSDPFDFSTIDGKATNPDPVNNATFVSITAKTFNWDDVIDADSYKIDIGTATGLADIVDDASCATSDYTYTGADWNYNKDYYWTVTTVYTAKADVTGDEWKFTTECDVVSTFPWIEGFENGGAMPSCWSQEYENGTHDWVFQNGGGYSHPANAHSGSYNAAFTHTSSGTVTKLVTPVLDLSGLTSPVLTFWHAQEVWPNDQDELRVYYKTSAGGTWTLIPGAVWINNIPNWTEETFTLPSPGSDYYIAFEGTDNYGYGVVVDDVSIYEAQSSIWGGYAKSNDWHTASNWSNGVPDASTSVIIPAGLNAYPTITVTAAHCYNLYMGSDASGAATLLDNSLLTVHGTAHIDRYFTGNGFDWHLVSSPISDAQAGIFTDMYLQSFDPTPTEAYGPGNNYGYTEIIDPLQGLSVMEGYALYSTLAATNTVSFVGNLNFSPQSHAFDLNGFNTEGWNLLGNPYVSSIDWEAVVIPTGMSNEVHYIDAATGNDLSYVQVTGGTGSQYIAPHQGFFVSATAAGTLSLGDAQRTHSGSATFYKNYNPQMLVLEAANENFSDQAWIHFNEQAGVEHDGTYDAYKRISLSNPELPQIFSITPSGVYLSINGLPETEMVHVGFTAVESGVFTISAIETGEFGKLVLEYLFTQTQADLVNNSYTFNYSAEDQENTFIVHFTPLAVYENAEETFNIYSYNKAVYVSVP